MNEDFVPKEIAKKLKEKGYYKKCFGYYLPSGDAGLIYNYNQYRGGIFEDCLFSHNSLGEDVVGHDLIDAPTIEQVLKWLREEKEIHITIDACVNDKFTFYYTILKKSDISWEVEQYCNEDYQIYEEAALYGIEYVIDNLI